MNLVSSPTLKRFADLFSVNPFQVIGSLLIKYPDGKNVLCYISRRNKGFNSFEYLVEDENRKPVDDDSQAPLLDLYYSTGGDLLAA